MIFVYYMILRWIELFEKFQQRNQSNNSIHIGTRKGETNFVWFDHFYNDNHKYTGNSDNQNGENCNDSHADYYCDMDGPNW